METINRIDRLNYIQQVGDLISKNVKFSMSPTSSRSTEKRVSQWEELMKKFSEAHQEECKYESFSFRNRYRF